MTLFSRTNKYSKRIESRNMFTSIFVKSIKETNKNNQNFGSSLNNAEDAPPAEKEKEAEKEVPLEDEHSLKLMNLYPLGFNKCEKELQDEKEEEGKNPDEEKVSKKPNVQTPSKKKKKKRNDEEEEEETEEGDGENKNTERSCVYNVWVLDCMRSKKDFLECQQIDMSELDTKEKFESELTKGEFFNSIHDYEDFKKCGKSTNTRILQGVEVKFDIEIDVTDSFYSLTGSRLRAYSFQGPNRTVVFSGFSYFKTSWTQEMYINTVMDYDVLFQPDNWYYTVIQADIVARIKDKGDDEAEESDAPKEEATNVSNKTCFGSREEFGLNDYRVPINYDDINFNQNRLETTSEVETVENNIKEKKYEKKNAALIYDRFQKFCKKYFKLSKINFRKIFFSTHANEINSLSSIISKNVKLINENNNKNLETSSSSISSESCGVKGNYKLADFLLDSFNKPIPIWTKMDNRKHFDMISNLKTIKKFYVKNQI